jgi:hypothetical protein
VAVLSGSSPSPPREPPATGVRTPGAFKWREAVRRRTAEATSSGCETGLHVGVQEVDKPKDRVI